MEGRRRRRETLGSYLNTCISSGEFLSSSCRRCQRRQALSSCCSRASWGGSYTGHRHTKTHAKWSHCVGQAFLSKDTGHAFLPRFSGRRGLEGLAEAELLGLQSPCAAGYSSPVCDCSSREHTPAQGASPQAISPLIPSSRLPLPGVSAWGGKRPLHLPLLFPTLNFVKDCL